MSIALTGGLLSYQTKHSAAFDLASTATVLLLPREPFLVPTGLYIDQEWSEPGFHLEICSRSGLAIKHNVVVLNSPGIVDLDYKGEIMVILINHGDKVFKVNVGDRIAQAVVRKTHLATGVEVSEKERGSGGFGSTGG